MQKALCKDSQVLDLEYLGINIYSKLSELFLLNFIPLINTIEDDLNHWTNLPLSQIGKIATVKIIILPKIIYLFRMILIQPTTNWFNSLNSITTKFYWKNKMPQIELSTLQKLITQRTGSPTRLSLLFGKQATVHQKLDSSLPAGQPMDRNRTNRM